MSFINFKPNKPKNKLIRTEIATTLIDNQIPFPNLKNKLRYANVDLLITPAGILRNNKGLAIEARPETMSASTGQSGTLKQDKSPGWGWPIRQRKGSGKQRHQAVNT